MSTVVPTSFVGVDSLDKTRFRFYCIDIYHFKICLHSLPPPPVITHFLLSPFTISHLQLLLIFSSKRNPSSITPLTSPYLCSSPDFPLLLSPPNATPNLGLSLFDYLIPTSRVILGLWSSQLLYNNVHG